MSLEILGYVGNDEDGSFLVVAERDGKHQIYQAESRQPYNHTFYRILDYSSEDEAVKAFRRLINPKGWSESKHSWPFSFPKEEFDEAVARFNRSA